MLSRTTFNGKLILYIIIVIHTYYKVGLCKILNRTIQYTTLEL